MCHTGRPYAVKFAYCMHSACTQSDCVGVSIIIYFYVFNLTVCFLETMHGRDHVADHTGVYRP